MAKVVLMKRGDEDADLTDLQALLLSIRSILEDDDLDASDRELMLATTCREYEDETGRSALDDLASTRGETKEPEMEKNVDVGGLAMFGLECLATAIRKREPELTEAQSFLRACNERPDILKIEREASRRRIAGVGLAQTEPEILNVLSNAEIRALVARESRRFPFVDGKELLAIVENSDEMKAHRAAVRQAQAAGRRAGETLMPAAVTKRDSAHGSLMEKAAEIRRAFPALTQEQSYAKAYSDPANWALVKAMRDASYEALYAA